MSELTYRTSSPNQRQLVCIVYPLKCFSLLLFFMETCAAKVLFYSHAWANKDVVESVKRELDSRGITGWIDTDGG